MPEGTGGNVVQPPRGRVGVPKPYLVDLLFYVFFFSPLFLLGGRGPSGRGGEVFSLREGGPVSALRRPAGASAPRVPPPGGSPSSCRRLAPPGASPALRLETDGLGLPKRAPWGRPKSRSLSRKAGWAQFEIAPARGRGAVLRARVAQNRGFGRGCGSATGRKRPSSSGFAGPGCHSRAQRRRAVWSPRSGTRGGERIGLPIPLRPPTGQPRLCLRQRSPSPPAKSSLVVASKSPRPQFEMVLRTRAVSRDVETAPATG